MGSISVAGADSLIFMDDSNPSARVGRIEFGPEERYWNWRTTLALEEIAGVARFFMFLCVWFCVFEILRHIALWRETK